MIERFERGPSAHFRLRRCACSTRFHLATALVSITSTSLSWEETSPPLGLRYDFWDGFDIDQRSNIIWQALSTQTSFNEPYLRDFQGGKGGKLENDDDNWGPRLGFSFDVQGNGRHIVRGGWGTFYDFPYTTGDPGRGEQRLGQLGLRVRF